MRADIAEAAGSQRVRFTPHQKILLLDVPGDDAHQDALAEVPSEGSS